MAEALIEVSRDKLTAKWVPIITAYERSAEKWEKAGKRIVKRYKDERNTRETSNSRYNILWSNVETLKPALFAQTPKAEVERRFKDKDPVGRVAADVLERCLDYELGQYSFGSTMRQGVLDYLLPGRGTAWVRYVPHMRDMALSTDVGDDGVEVSEDAEVGGPAEGEKPEEVYYEEVLSDYVHWQDFGHTEARTWEEVTAVWRKVYLTRGKLVERFGKEKGDAIPLDFTPKGMDGQGVTDAVKKATIYEIWDRDALEAIWISKHYHEALDQREDPLKLEKFFPCPRPLYATLGNDSLIPVPDYVEYQDQADELDQLTGRIDQITKALKVAGVYDGSAPALERLLNDGVENQLIPVEKWTGFAEKGGLKGSIEFLPIQEIAATLLHLYECREHVKQDLYEITGMADIIRGASNPNTTATAEKIKSHFITMRLDERQREVQRFTRNVVDISGQIIAGHFQLDTIQKISGVQLLTKEEKAQIGAYQAQQKAMQMQQQPPQPGMPTTQQPMAPPMPQMPPPPPDKVALMGEPTWDEVYALLKNDTARCFRIDIETDSTIAGDEDQAKQEGMEFLQAIVPFMEQVFQAPPGLAPLMGQILGAIVRRFKFGKTVEGAIEAALDQFEQQAKQPPKPPQPDPTDLAKIQADQATDNAAIQGKQAIENAKISAKQASDAQAAQAAAAQADADRKHEASMEVMRQHYASVEADAKRRADAVQASQEAATEAMLTQFSEKLEAATKVIVANIAAKAATDAANTAAASATFDRAEA